MNIPGNLKYTNDHEWINLNGQTAVIGITDYAQSELGDIVFLEIETCGIDAEAELRKIATDIGQNWQLQDIAICRRIDKLKSGRNCPGCRCSCASSSESFSGLPICH